MKKFLPKDLFRLMEGDANVIEGESVKFFPQEIPGLGKGYVCIGCGNRGIVEPFMMMTRLDLQLKINHGALEWSIRANDMKKAIQKAGVARSGESTFGAGTALLGSSMLICSSCHGPVMDIDDADSIYCEDHCTGCLICNNYQTDKQVASVCKDCPVYHSAVLSMDIGDFDEFEDDHEWKCIEMFHTGECNNLMARRAYHKLRLPEIEDVLSRGTVSDSM